MPEVPVITAEKGAELVVGVILVSSSNANNQWYKDGAKIEGAVNSTYFTSQAGVYSVQVNLEGCSGTLSEEVEVKKVSQSIHFPDIKDGSFTAGEVIELISFASSGLPVRYELESGFVRIDGRKLFIDAPGLVTLVAFQDGNAIYEAAEAVKISFCVLPNRPLVGVEGGGSAGTSVVLVSDSPEGNQWFHNGVLIEGATAQRYEVSDAGTFSVQLSVGECAIRSEEVVITGMAHADFAGALNVYPNPVEDKVKVEFSSTKPGREIEVRVINSSGTMVPLAARIHEQQQIKTAELDLCALPVGVYLVWISDGKTITRAKILKE